MKKFDILFYSAEVKLTLKQAPDHIYLIIDPEDDIYLSESMFYFSIPGQSAAVKTQGGTTIQYTVFSQLDALCTELGIREMNAIPIKIDAFRGQLTRTIVVVTVMMEEGATDQETKITVQVSQPPKYDAMTGKFQGA